MRKEAEACLERRGRFLAWEPAENRSTAWRKIRNKTGSTLRPFLPKSSSTRSLSAVSPILKNRPCCRTKARLLPSYWRAWWRPTGA